MIKILQKYTESPSEEVRVTCQLGVRKLETFAALKGFFKKIKIFKKLDFFEKLN